MVVSTVEDVPGALHDAVSVVDSVGFSPCSGSARFVHVVQRAVDHPGVGPHHARNGPGFVHGRLSSGGSAAPPCLGWGDRSIRRDACLGRRDCSTAAVAGSPGGGTDSGGVLPGGHRQQRRGDDRAGRCGAFGGDDQPQHLGRGGPHPSAHGAVSQSVRAGRWLVVVAARAAGGVAAGGIRCGVEAGDALPGQSR